MAKDSSPLCFRLSPDDRRLIEIVAEYNGETTSEFVRRAAVSTARAIVDRQGKDEVMRHLMDSNTRATDEKARYLESMQPVPDDRRPTDD